MLRLRTACLEQAASILAPLYEPVIAQSVTPAKPRHTVQTVRATRTARAVSGKNRAITQLRLLEHITEHTPVSRSELLLAFGGSPHALDKKLRRLLAKGEIAVDGRRGARAYRSPRPSEPTATPQALSGILPASPTQPERGVYPVYDAVLDLGGATTQQLVEHTELPTSVVVEQGRRLKRFGHLRFTGVGDGRVWLPTPTEVSRDAI